jgi:polar amino acid transport system substrate-binding protein
MRLFFAIADCAVAFNSSVVNSQELLILTEEFKPYQYQDENGRPTGFMVELIDTVFEKAGIAMEGGAVRIDVWEKDYETLLGTDNAAAFMTVRTTDRETLLKWVGPLAPRDTWLYKLKKRGDIQVKTLDDAKAYKIGGYQSAQTDYLIALGFPNVDIAPQERMNVARLLSGEVDMVPSLEPMMSQRLKDLGESDDAVEKVILFDDRFDYYLALNPHVSDDVVDRLQAALDAAKADGTYDRLKAKYIN